MAEVAYSRDRVNEIVLSELDSLRQRIIENHVKAGQVASGKTKDSLTVEATKDGATLWGHKPFGVLETGRKPGNTPKNFTTIIRQWVINKGISVPAIPYIRQPSERWQPKYTPQERGIMSFAGAVAHKIKTEGTKLHRNGGRNDIYSKEIPASVNKISERIAVMFSQEVESININTKSDEI